MRILGDRRLYAWRYTFGLLTPAGTCKYHPSCSQYALDALREARPGEGIGEGRLARAPLQPVEPRRGRPRMILAEPAPAARGPAHLGPGAPARLGRALLGVVDRGARRDRADAARAADRPPDPLDAEPPGARAGDEEDPAAVQARPPEDERRDDGVLQGEPDQPGRVVPADPGAVPGLHFALLRAQGLREARAGGGQRARLDGADQHHREHEDGLGAAPDRLLRREPADVVVPDVDDDAAGAARDAADPADRLHPVRAQLPRRPDALLADDEPVDDGPGPDHPPPDAQAATAAEEELAHAAEG